MKQIVINVFVEIPRGLCSFQNPKETEIYRADSSSLWLIICSVRTKSYFVLDQQSPSCRAGMFFVRHGVIRMALTPPPPSYGQLHLHRLIGQSLGYHGSIFRSQGRKMHQFYFVIVYNSEQFTSFGEYLYKNYFLCCFLH